MSVERIETVVIGGGQAGLTMSHCLTRLGLPHVVLERHRIAERWRSERWESLRFQFPNWAMRLPEFPYAGADPEAFAARDDVVRFIEAYANFIRAPVRTCVAVHALRRGAGGFVLDTTSGPIEARHVVIATGPYQQPAIPEAARELGGVVQLSASTYRNPDQLPPGGVLVVGAGASGCQIAEELLRSGRAVVLSVGAHRRVPRRYRGKDFIWWIEALGLDNKVVDDETARQAPLIISGANGGHTIDLRGFAAAGMTLAGRVSGARNGTISFSHDLFDNLAAGDASYAGFVQLAEACIARVGLTLPADTEPAAVFPDPPVPPDSLDLGAAGITSVIWATGYRTDFDWIHLDLFTQRGDPPVRMPVHRRGVTDVEGVCFLGLPLLYKTKSSFLSGVGEDAAHLAHHIARLRSQT